MRFWCLTILLFLYFDAFSDWGKREHELGDSIIRQAIALKNYERKLNLKANAYLKNTLVLDKAPKRFLGKNVKKLLKLKDTEKQALYIHEAISDLYFSDSKIIKEDISFFKNYGEFRQAWRFNKASDLLLDFNENYVELEGFSDKKYVSPIANSAFKYYDFFFDKTFEDENGIKLYSIRIYPKNFFEPAFYGYIFINAATMQITNLSLNLGDNGGISLINYLTIHQDLIKIDNFYYPSQTKINYYGNNFGFAYSGVCVATFNYFTQNEAEENIFNKYESLKIERQNQEGEAKLQLNRPIPLTPLEKSSYRLDDSLKNAQGKKKYLDSLDNLSLQQRISPFLFSKFNIQNTYKEYSISFDAIAPSLFYNTVEGPGIKYGVRYTKYREFDGSFFTIKPEVRYGFKNKEFNSDIAFSWLYSPQKRGVLGINMGSTYRDLNPNGSLSTLYNSLNSLLFEQNFMKLFRKTYGSVSSGREITNGLYLSGGIELSRNISVSNMYDYSFRKIKDKNFTSNNPFDEDDGKLFPDHTTLRFSSTLVYTFNHQYISKEGVKIYKIPDNPRLILTYKKGIPGIFGSESNFDYLEFEVQQEKLDIGLWGYASFSVSAGKFLNHKVNYFPDWKQFGGNMALIFNPGLKNFHLLDYYTYSTDREFIEGHWEHNYNTKFFGSIPLIRKLKLQELTGAALLVQPEKGLYYEIYVGLQRLGGRIDYAFSFDNHGLLNHGFKFSFRFQSPYKFKQDRY
ncbi:DUF5686 family protein [Pseudopedobacter beijingensis]|uniref:DUF5686 family protein n=1 Tax=Pseudopedobacter beijingensis TaxID=1207056 RepID=UPI0036D42DD8